MRASDLLGTDSLNLLSNGLAALCSWYNFVQKPKNPIPKIQLMCDGQTDRSTIQPTDTPHKDARMHPKNIAQSPTAVSDGQMVIGHGHSWLPYLVQN